MVSDTNKENYIDNGDSVSIVFKKDNFCLKLLHDILIYERKLLEANMVHLINYEIFFDYF